MVTAALLLMLAAAPASTPAEEAYVVIVANNASADGTLTPLRYADDDGAKYFELFSLLTDHVQILTVLDPSSQGVFPEVAKASRAPTRAALLETLDRTFSAIAEDTNARGVRSVFYFVYIGHGGVGDDGEGAMHLLDGRFTRSDLFQHVISASPATINHVIIDACNAYLMVARRGEDASDRAVKQFLDRESLAKHPNTGVLVSTSHAADVHEWARFEAGVFSHEVRSGLIGAADVDGDGEVRYDELRAFISAANAQVRDPKARLNAFAAAPAIHLNEPLFSRSDLKADAPTLTLPRGLANRYFLEDERGVRYADFHMGADTDLTLTLVPSSFYFLRDDKDETRIDLLGLRNVDAAKLQKRPAQIAMRGSEAVTFQRDLFAVPFGRAYFEGFKASSMPLPADSVSTNLDESPPLSTQKIVALSLGAGAVAAGVAGIVYGLAASSAASDYQAAIGSATDIEALRSSSQSKAQTANVLFMVGGGLVAGGAALWFLDD